MKLILISFYLAVVCNNIFHPPGHTMSAQSMEVPSNSTKIVMDSIPTGTYLGPSIEVTIKYNFVLLDQFVIGDISKLKAAGNKPPDRKFIYPAGSVVSLTPTNKNSAIESMYLKFDNAPEARYSEPIRLSAKGNHSLVVKLRDQWGVELVSDSINFKVLSY